MADPADLITLARALPSLPAAAATDTLIPALITAASKAVRRYLKRNVIATDYDRVDVPAIGDQFKNDPPCIWLAEFPVNAVYRVASGRTQALAITNTDAVTNQRATFELTVTGDPEIQLTPVGVTLTRIASGVTTTTPFLFATYPTIAGLATAINLLGAGWSATTQTPYTLWPSTELYAPFAPVGCLSGTTQPQAGLDLFATDLGYLSLDRASGEMYLSGWGSSTVGNPQLWPNATGSDWGTWGRQVRTRWNAGWATIPEPIQQATGVVVQAMYWDNRTSDVFKNERIGDYSYTLNDRGSGIPDSAATILAPYRVWRV